MAQTPDAIRKKLESREFDAGTAGKASFGSKDIEPIAPQEVAPPRKPKVKEEPPEPPTDKAIFESKDLSSTPPGKQ